MEQKTVLQEVSVTFPASCGLEQGLTILHFGDLHWRSRSPRVLERQVRSVLESTPADLVVFTGDTVNRHRFWQKASTWLADLDIDGLRLAVPGNWDYSRNGLLDEFRSVWTDAGFQVLNNQRIQAAIHGQEIDLIGWADARVGSPAWPLAEEPVGEGPFRILLTHNPDVLLAGDRVHFNLMLCGHTHGGQIRVPGIGAVVTSTRIGRKFDKGLFRLGPTQYVFITSGIGSGNVPVRIGCPPEVALLTVKIEPS